MNSILINNKNFIPSKVICIGRNYVDHIKELDNEIPKEPVIFMKPNSAVSDEITITSKSQIHYEAEISFVIKNSQISAVGIGLDLTKRQIQSDLKAKGLPWERAKAFDGSVVFSDFIEFEGAIDNLRLELYINGKLTQSGGVALMLHKPEQLIKEIKAFMTLEDGDIVMTGTPKGVGCIHKNDRFIGKIYNTNSLLVERKWVA